MVNFPEAEEVNQFRVGQAIDQSQKDLQTEDNEPYVETDMELKSLLLSLKANSINPLFNKTDLVLGTIKDQQQIKFLRWYLNVGIALYEAGMKESAKYCADIVLTMLNFNRSESGMQQQFLITRVKKQQLDLAQERQRGMIGKVSDRISQ